MKTQIQNLKRMLLLFTVLLAGQTALSQHEISISGIIKNALNNEPVPYASAILLDPSDSSQVKGTVTNIEGKFKMATLQKGEHILEISHMSYKPRHINVNINDGDSSKPRVIYLNEKSVDMEKLVILGERIKAKNEGKKTIYFMTKKIQQVSNTGVDILKIIPGIQMDLMQNISLNGSQDISIYVDGKKRDLAFVKQLNSNQIEKVEINTTPGAEYEANTSGVINILLKERMKGFSGHVYAQAPATEEVYLFPSYSLNYGSGKFNFYTSYNGEISKFPIVEQNNRQIFHSSGTTDIKTKQYVNQNNWSHRFHYGIDYFMDKKNQFNFYGFYNPYSQEHDGSVNITASGEETGSQYWSADKEDTDINHKNFASLYYKHIFNKPGQQIIFDLSYYNLQAENTTQYTYDSIPAGERMEETNTVKPRQNSISLRVDFTSPLSSNLNLDAGIKGKMKKMHDAYSDALSYREEVFAGFASVSYKYQKIQANAGIRAEQSQSAQDKNFEDNVFAFLPHASINMKIGEKQSLKLAFKRSVTRPNIYQLNPAALSEDPYTTRKGNPNLSPSFRSNLFLDHSLRFGSNYLSTRLFYNHATNVINRFTFINDAGFFSTAYDNLGTAKVYGIQLSGALKLGKAISVNPYAKSFFFHAEGNETADQYEISNMHKLIFEGGISAIIQLNETTAASVMCQYTHPRMSMQSTHFNDALYFISLEKTFSKNIKAGIKTGVPFANSFTYFGTETHAKNFNQYSKGNIKMSSVPLWIHLRYQFNTGKEIQRIQRQKEKIENLPKKGF